MSDPINRHDARALALIDHALNEGRFTAELVEQIREALASASHAETETHSTTSIHPGAGVRGGRHTPG
jgi:hypothetical protein